MLRWIAVAAGLLTTVVLANFARPAYAAGGGGCTGANCWVVVTGPPIPGTRGGGSAGSGGGTQECYVDYGGSKVPIGCWSNDYGYYNVDTECYYMKESPQPTATDPIWDGHARTGGAIFHLHCLAAGGGLFTVVDSGLMWLAAPPPGTATGPSPAQVAAEALADLTVGAPEIGTAPQTTGNGLVGLPVWLWSARNTNTWGPIPVSKTDRAVTVNVEADAQYIVWDMGDGHTVTCDNPGTAFALDSDSSSSPTCGYRYLAPSRNQPGGAYTVTATTHWLVTWTANTGDGGTLSTDVSSTTTITIDELEVVTS